ncbi:hypothetical protein AHAS_Ahas13G0333400 [Arachis hypogaea]
MEASPKNGRASTLTSQFFIERSSSLDYASTQSFPQNPYKSSHQSHNSFHIPQHNFTTIHPCHQNYSQPSSLEPTDEDYLQAIEIHRKLVEIYTKSPSWKEIVFKKMNGPLEQTKGNLEPSNSKDEDQLMDVKDKVEEQDKEATASSELSMKNEVVENETALEVTKEHSQPSQTSLESVIEKYEEEMKKSWEEQQTSSIKELLSQMLGAKKGVEEHESEEVIPENSHSSEAENHMKEGLMEPPIQEALNEEITPIITQQPCLDIQEVKAIDKSTKKRIVTKITRTTFMRRSTANNPPPDPASKINQANFTRKLVERRPRQGTITETSPLLESFLLTNWKKRKKVKNNMSS